MPDINLNDLGDYLSSVIDLKILDTKCPVCGAGLYSLGTHFIDNKDVRAVGSITISYKCNMKIDKDLRENTFKVSSKCVNAVDIILQENIDKRNTKAVAQESNRFTELK